MHRPGIELQRITPRHKDRLLFGGLPWVSKARQEHDVLSQQLRDQGVAVLFFTELLQDALEYQAARAEAIGMAIADAGLGDELRGQLRAHLEDLAPEVLAQVLIAGLTPQELKIGRGVVFELLDRHDFVLDPLPNLVFTRDSSFWVGDRVAVASLAAGHRRRETDLASVVYRHHPRFTGIKWLYGPGLEPVHGGDVLLLAPGVIALGVGQRTSPAGDGTPCPEGFRHRARAHGACGADAPACRGWSPRHHLCCRRHRLCLDASSGRLHAHRAHDHAAAGRHAGVPPAAVP